MPFPTCDAQDRTIERELNDGEHDRTRGHYAQDVRHYHEGKENYKEPAVPMADPTWCRGYDEKEQSEWKTYQNRQPERASFWITRRQEQLRPPKPFPIAARPGIATHVIAAFFPKARLILGEEAHAFDPLGGFPGVKLRNN